MTSETHNDSNTEFYFFKDEVKKFVEERGWAKYHTSKNLIQAMGVELAELSELFLFKDFKKKEIIENPELFANIKEEVADIFIYLVSFINRLDFDLTSIFIKKMLKNEKKYPINEFKDGKYYKK
ncbi:MAG: nucleotide pyrophosphohydrolase [Promethearchaeota archaeon]|nr:MAG: nucleotide pyrophosphohydrolase [Candidatus Lokiarchaeota archaeon]